MAGALDLFGVKALIHVSKGCERRMAALFQCLVIGARVSIMTDEEIQKVKDEHLNFTVEAALVRLILPLLNGVDLLVSILSDVDPESTYQDVLEKSRLSAKKASTWPVPLVDLEILKSLIQFIVGSPCGTSWLDTKIRALEDRTGMVRSNSLKTAEISTQLKEAKTLVGSMKDLHIGGVYTNNGVMTNVTVATNLIKT